MIRILVAHEGTLVRGALAFLLAAEPDVETVAQVDRLEQVPDAVRAHHPDVTVLDLDLLPREQWGRPGSWLPGPAAGGGRGGLLVLAGARHRRALGSLLAAAGRGVGLVGTDGPPHRLVTAVRGVARGESVVDPDLVVAVIRAPASPLTPREAEVLGAAAEGAPVREVARRLGLSPGTVRNHLSRVITKAGARTRIDAARIAEERGWI